MNIELERHPRTKNAGDEDCVWHLIVNGYRIGTWYGGKNKLYEDKYDWADRQIAKRVPIIQRNISRLSNEIEELKKELTALEKRN